MAKPIEMMPTPRNAREDLKRKLDNAPLEYADALLDGYELLQQLHETGTIRCGRPGGETCGVACGTTGVGARAA
jgi:hypothetical protein